MKTSPPNPKDIVEARKSSGLTQTQSANLVSVSLRTWQQWEAGDRRMGAGLWELFCMKVANKEQK